MAIENNLPIIFDTATQTEDGLMSYQDKIKLDNVEQTLLNKLGKQDKISSSQLDTSTDAAKIQPANLSDAVKSMMTGQTAVEATVPNNGVTTEKLATNSVTIDKIDKRVMLANVVSSKPINFVFKSASVSITIPKGSLVLSDAISARKLANGSETTDVTLNIVYPNPYIGLNYIVSRPDGSITMVNNANTSSISAVDSVIALILLLNDSFRATVVMNGNYAVNGLVQNIETESATLTGTGKIVFDTATGIIDFTKATELFLTTEKIYNKPITNQASIRIGNYSEDGSYVLLWDNNINALRVDDANATTDNTNKIAIIKDGRIIPFVNTGIYYSKPYIEAPYYSESFDFIDNIGLTASMPVNINTIETTKLEIPENTYVFLNQTEIKVANTECYYENKEGLHYILFDLDAKTLYCRHYNSPIDSANKNIVIGTMWITNGKFPQVAGNFNYTVNGKTPYQDDLSAVEESILELQNTVVSPQNNAITNGIELFMINGEEMPFYSSSMMLRETLDLKTAMIYTKDGDVKQGTRTQYINGNAYITPDHLGNEIMLVANNGENTHAVDFKVNKVDPDFKKGQTVKVLCLGDELTTWTVEAIKGKLESYEVNPIMVGTMNTNGVSNEGRKGWFYSTFVGASGRGKEEGKINPQVSEGESSILLNPFVRIANAEDKATRPDDCYRATGAYAEKSYTSDSDKNGAFYIFDFAKYLETQEIQTPDVVIITIKPENALVMTENVISTNMTYLKQLVNGIRKALPNVVIGLVPQYGNHFQYEWEPTFKMIDEVVIYCKNSSDTKLKVIPAWLHMARNFPFYNEVELANAISAFIMNI